MIIIQVNKDGAKDMGYQIEAFLDKGKPSLKIYDIATKSLYLSWTYNNDNSESSSHKEVHDLFRQLLLLTCKQDICNVRVFNITPCHFDS